MNTTEYKKARQSLVDGIEGMKKDLDALDRIWDRKILPPSAKEINKFLRRWSETPIMQEKANEQNVNAEPAPDAAVAAVPDTGDTAATPEASARSTGPAAR